MTHRITGCCMICDEPMFEVLTFWTTAHPRAGEPRRLGAPADNAERVTFLLVDGSSCDLTVCSNCADGAEDRLPEIWAKAVGATARDEEQRAAIGARLLTPEQASANHASLLQLIDNVPLGVLGRIKYTELNDATALA